MDEPITLAPGEGGRVKADRPELSLLEVTFDPGSGVAPHLHRGHSDSFYVLEGEVEFLLGDELVQAGAGHFVNVPRGTVHRFTNTGMETARLVLTFTPAGIERWFEQTLERAPNEVRPEDVPDNVAEVAARYVEAAPAYGLVFV